MRTLILLLTPVAAFLQTQQIRVKKVETTATQAVIVFEAPDTADCQVKVAYDSGLTSLAHDTNATLFPGSQNCGRAGNLVEGNTVTFVAGLRRAEKAADGKFYSRALEANTTLWVEIRSGGQTLAPQRIETRNPPLGNAYGEPFPFDPQAPGNYAWPTMDWTDLNKEYIDPLTGVKLKRFSGPGMVKPALSDVTAALGAFDRYAAWTNAANGALVDGSAATVASSQSPLFVRAPRLCISPWDCGVHTSWGNPGYSIDNIQATVKAWCTTPECAANAAGERNLELCITVDGVRCVTAWKSITAGTGSGSAAVAYPAALTWSALAEWYGGDFVAPPARPHMSNYFGSVNTNGTAVTLASGDRFPVEAWTAGSRITISGSEYVIASVNSATSLTLESSAGVLSSASYAANNVGVLLRKSHAGADTMQVDGVTFRWAHSTEMEMGASGFRDACSPQAVTDFEGAQGYVCSFKSPQGYPGLWLVSEKGKARFLGTPEIPFNADVAGGSIDGNNVGDCIYGFSISSTNPNQVFCVTYSSVQMGQLIFKGTYHPEGRAGCADPPGYAGIARGKTCLFTWQNITKPSQNRSMAQQIATVTSYNSNVFGAVRMFGAMGRHLGFFAWPSQDNFAFSFWFDDTGTLVSWQDYHSTQPCRWCVVHSFFEAGQPDTGAGGWNAVVVKDTVGGHHEVGVTAVEGSGDGSLNNSLQQACPADLADEFKEKGAVGNHCITVTLAGNPCKAGATATELNHFADCPWLPGGLQMQELQVGDEAYGVSNGVQTNERFLVVKNLGGNQWVLLRDYSITYGPQLAEISSSLANHAVGWKLRMACSAAVSSAYVWVKFTDPNHPVLRDYALSPAQHGDISPLGSMQASYCGEIDRYCLPLWQRGIPDRIGKKADRRWVLGHTFGNYNVWGFDGFRQFIQSHPSWRQVTAEPHEQGWYLDGNPWAASAGGNYGLWSQPSAHITGSLYQLTSVAHTPIVRKLLATIAWAGHHLLKDVSGPGSLLTGDAADNWSYCVADIAGECRPGSAAGSVYVNIPGAVSDGACGESFYFRRPCFTSMVLPGVGINQVGVRQADIAANGQRFLTAHLQRYNIGWTYSNAAPTPSGRYAVISGSWLDGRRNDLLLMKVPPFPSHDSIARANFVPVTIGVAGYEGSTRVRVRFGYAENGPAGSYYCTSRKEACTTGGSPFSWLSEAAAPLNCPSTGCRVEAPAISGRVLYYLVERLNEGGVTVDSSTRGAVAVP